MKYMFHGNFLTEFLIFSFDNTQTSNFRAALSLASPAVDFDGGLHRPLAAMGWAAV